MNLDQHLTHLLSLMEPPFTEAFKAHWWARANELAKYPELAELPSMLEAAMRERSKKSTPEPPCTEPPASTNGVLTSITSLASK